MPEKYTVNMPARKQTTLEHSQLLIGPPQPKFHLVQAALAELLGTALFIFVGCGAIMSNGAPPDVLLVAMTHGIAIVTLVFAMGEISGGQFNPAVSLALFLHNDIPALHALVFAVSQIIGSLLGGAFLKASFPSKTLKEFAYGAHNLNTNYTPGQGIFVEFLLSTLLIFTILSVVKSKDPQPSGFIAIGFAVLVDHLIGVKITGASMNPARSFGPAVFANHFEHHYIYWVGPALGAIFAALLHRLLFKPKQD
eukprot:m.14789 g.14789  ORF g.14789 m.14789 type:complete len:252 (+) comp9344_c0_seq2:143-898(+)